MDGSNGEVFIQSRAEHSLFLNPDDLLDVVSAGLQQAVSGHALVVGRQPCGGAQCMPVSD